MLRPDDYVFDGQGNVDVKKTNDDYDRVMIPKSKLATVYDIGNGSAQYDSDGNLSHKVKKGTIVNLNKEAVIGDRVGTRFTITDNNVADDIYKMIGGNSSVEYSKTRYLKNPSTKYNDMWTIKEPDKTNNAPMYELAKSYPILEYTHSHTLNELRDTIDEKGRPAYTGFSSINPSGYDAISYKHLQERKSLVPNLANTKTNIYNPLVSPDLKEFKDNKLLDTMTTKFKNNKEMVDFMSKQLIKNNMIK